METGKTSTPRFQKGQIIRHRVWGYRGVILAVDETFQGDDDWYWAQSISANQAPPRDRPWYSVQVQDSPARTYVAEQNLELDANVDPGADRDNPDGRILN